jgi:hypothetical protein
VVRECQEGHSVEQIADAGSTHPIDVARVGDPPDLPPGPPTPTICSGPNRKDVSLLPGTLPLCRDSGPLIFRPATTLQAFVLFGLAVPSFR